MSISGGIERMSIVGLIAVAFFIIIVAVGITLVAYVVMKKWGHTEERERELESGKWDDRF